MQFFPLLLLQEIKEIMDAKTLKNISGALSGWNIRIKPLSFLPHHGRQNANWRMPDIPELEHKGFAEIGYLTPLLTLRGRID